MKEEWKTQEECNWKPLFCIQIICFALNYSLFKLSGDWARYLMQERELGGRYEKKKVEMLKWEGNLRQEREIIMDFYMGVSRV